MIVHCVATLHAALLDIDIIFENSLTIFKDKFSWCVALWWYKIRIHNQRVIDTYYQVVKKLRIKENANKLFICTKH